MNTTGDDQFKFVDNSNKCVETFVPKPGALLSVIGAYCVIREVIVDLWERKSTKATPISRVILSMSICDLFFSFGIFLSAWPSPKELPNLCGNVGSQGFCTFQGFIIQFGQSGAFSWSGTLAVFYLLLLRYNWTGRQLERLEKWLHGGIWSTMLGLSVDLSHSS